MVLFNNCSLILSIVASLKEEVYLLEHEDTMLKKTLQRRNHIQHMIDQRV